MVLGIIRFNSIIYQGGLSVHLKKSKLSAASYKSCVNHSLLKLPDETKVIHTLPIFKLRFVLGITNKLFDHLITIVSQSNSCSLKLVKQAKHLQSTNAWRRIQWKPKKTSRSIA